MVTSEQLASLVKAANQRERLRASRPPTSGERVAAKAVATIVVAAEAVAVVDPIAVAVATIAETIAAAKRR